MNENEMRIAANDQEDDTNLDYISALNEMKKNSVSKDDYQKLKTENKKLLDALIEGKQIETPNTQVDIDSIRQELYGDRDASIDPLVYVTKTLQLRQAIIDSGADDPAIPTGHMYSPTSLDKETSQKVADVVQECVDVADGNTAVFMSELQRVLKDTPAMRRK